MTQPTVVCVLRTGERIADRQPYRVAHVVKLRKGVARHLSIPHRFVCITDQVQAVRNAGITAIPLPQDWPGWWAKIALFMPTLLTGPTLYSDLDNLVVGPLDDLIRRTPGITMTADFSFPEAMNSSVMAWNGDFSAIWQVFLSNAETLIGRYDRRRGALIGDQGFIHDTLRRLAAPIDTFERAHVVSFKRDARVAAPADARIISFHGTPKPDSAAAGWAHEAWAAL
jgi:hypothetical protein